MLRAKWDAGSNHERGTKWVEAEVPDNVTKAKPSIASGFGSRQLSFSSSSGGGGTTQETKETKLKETKETKDRQLISGSGGGGTPAELRSTQEAEEIDAQERRLSTDTTTPKVPATDADRTYSLPETLKNSTILIPLAGRAEGRTRVVDLYDPRSWRSKNDARRNMLFCGGGIVGIALATGIYFVVYAIVTGV